MDSAAGRLRPPWRLPHVWRTRPHPTIARKERSWLFRGPGATVGSKRFKGEDKMLANAVFR